MVVVPCAELDRKASPKELGVEKSEFTAIQVSKLQSNCTNVFMWKSKKIENEEKSPLRFTIRFKEKSNWSELKWPFTASSLFVFDADDRGEMVKSWRIRRWNDDGSLVVFLSPRYLCVCVAVQWSCFRSIASHSSAFSSPPISFLSEKSFIFLHLFYSGHQIATFFFFAIVP